MNEDRGARYHRLRRQAGVVSTIAAAAWLGALALTGWAAGLPLAAAVAVLAAGGEAVTFPFTVYKSFVLDRRYGLTSESFATWLRDHLKAFALGLALSEIAAFAVYWSMGAAGAAWWGVSAIFFAAAGMLLSRLAPVILMPLFYRFRPLEREALRERLMLLSQRAGVRVLGAFEWGLGEKTTRANAALVGAGRTRRILLSDTLLQQYSDDEIEVILAHELAHHVHHDLWSALALETGVVAAALLIGHVAIRAAGYQLADPASLPLLVLAAGAVSLALTPIGTAWSRHNERRADRFALALTGRHDAFISAMRRLGAQNLAETDPSPPVRWFFHTHPTIDERIAAARQAGS
ncbi:MAG TPA: M48 family metallopeptidase [Vicinamibacterales bacterium]|nr:M48 family metallopeptidase [Vicinamibacterales bacterium]